MGTEKRAHARFPLILAVDYPGSAATIRDYTENLSAEGLFIRTEREFEVGERVALLLSFPEMLDPLELEVEVVRTRPGVAALAAGVAVRIPPDRQQDRHALERLAASVEAQSVSSDMAHRVLLVEDNSLVAAMYASALRRLAQSEGISAIAIDVAVDGNEAFARLLAEPPIDLVITDVYMPVMTGFTLVEKIRAEPRLHALPIVVISSAGEEDRQRLGALGVSRFLQKPVKYQEIVDVVRGLLRAGRQPGAPMASNGLHAPTPDASPRPEAGIEQPPAGAPIRPPRD